MTVEDQPGVGTDEEAPPAATDPRRWAALAVLALVQFIIVIDNTIVNVALPSIQHHLNFSTDGLAWVVNGYMLTAGGLLLLGGRIGDFVGHRRMFLGGAAVFGLASLASGLSTTALMLVASRFAQGAGEAMASPAALALIAGLFTGRERGKALGIWGSLGGLGSIVGVLLSGMLVQWSGWRWIFLINIPFAVIAIVLLPRVVDDNRAPAPRGRLDVAGAALVTTGLTLAVAALLHAASHPWSSLGTVLPLALSLACLAGFVAVEATVANPLAPLGFFADRSRVSANLVSALLTAVMAGMFLLLTLYQQEVLHYTALRTGLAYLPFCLAFGPGFGVSAVLMNKFGTRTALVAAFLVSTAGMLLMARISLTGDYVRELLPAMLVLAIGLGMAFPAAQNAALAGTTRETAGLASGVQTAVQALGGSLGVAVLVTIAARAAGGSAHPVPSAALVHGYRVAFTVGAAVYAVAALIVLVGVDQLRAEPTPA
jgi:EmrB/QacA subfamily drug resistance transporter